MLLQLFPFASNRNRSSQQSYLRPAILFKNRGSNTDAFLSILQNFNEHLIYRAPPDDYFCVAHTSWLRIEFTHFEKILMVILEKKNATLISVQPLWLFFVLLLRISFKVPYGLNLTFWKIQKLRNSRLLDFNILEPPYTLTNVYVSGVYTMSILHYVNVQIVLRYIMFEWILTA